jgi:hypothetical protein
MVLPDPESNGQRKSRLAAALAALLAPVACCMLIALSPFLLIMLFAARDMAAIAGEVVWNDHSHLTAQQVAGRYRCVSDAGTETLDLLPDGTVLQTLAWRSGRTRAGRGTWETVRQFPEEDEIRINSPGCFQAIEDGPCSGGYQAARSNGKIEYLYSSGEKYGGTAYHLLRTGQARPH